MKLREERDKALFAAYRKAQTEQVFKDQRDAANYVRAHEAPKFYVTQEFCQIIIGKMIRGEDLGNVGSIRKRRAKTLFERYNKLVEENGPMTVKEASGIIVEQEAPEFFLGEIAALRIINKQRRIWQETVASQLAR